MAARFAPAINSELAARRFRQPVNPEGRPMQFAVCQLGAEIWKRRSIALGSASRIAAAQRCYGAELVI